MPATAATRPLARALVPRVLSDAGIPFIDQPQEDVSVLPRLAGTGTWLFNHGTEDATVANARVPAGDFVFRPEPLG